MLHCEYVKRQPIYARALYPLSVESRTENRVGTILMGNTIKTKVNDASVNDFINRIEDDTKRQDSLALLEIYKQITHKEPKMWGASIIGFDQEGDWPLAAFSPRKQNLTLYVEPGLTDFTDLLGSLGKHKISKACLYINKLADVDRGVLEKIIARSYLSAKKADKN